LEKKNELLFYVGAVIHHYGNLKWHYKTQGQQKKVAVVDDTRPKDKWN
jgi:hypothetical protein